MSDRKPFRWTSRQTGKTVEEIIQEFPILYEAWECDSTAWIVQFDDGTVGLITTDHGSFKETSAEFLEQKIAEYHNAAEQTKAALGRLQEP